MALIIILNLYINIFNFNNLIIYMYKLIMKYVKNLIDYNKDIAKIVGFTLILFHIIIINITMYFLFLSNNIKYFFIHFISFYL